MEIIAEREPTHKVVILGDSQVGKTSILTRQILGYHPMVQNPTIGCHCSEVHILLDGREVMLQLWDTAGQEIYRSLVPIYLRGARAAILVYDVTTPTSFVALSHWHRVLSEVVPHSINLYIVANKIDLEPQISVDNELGKQFAATNQAPFFKVSALTGQGVDVLFEAIARDMGQLSVTQEVSSTAINRMDAKQDCKC
jgi:Ras-related protein Rab-21